MGKRQSVLRIDGYAIRHLRTVCLNTTRDRTWCVHCIGKQGGWVGSERSVCSCVLGDWDRAHVNTTGASLRPLHARRGGPSLGPPPPSRACYLGGWSQQCGAHATMQAEAELVTQTVALPEDADPDSLHGCLVLSPNGSALARVVWFKAYHCDER